MPLYKYMSAEGAPLFARTLKVRFTQPSDLNDPFEFRPLIDFKGTAEEFRGVVDAKIAEIFGTADSILAKMEQLQATDPSFPKLPVATQVLRKMFADNPILGQQFISELQKYKDAAMNEMLGAIQWEALWEKIQQALGQAVGIFSMTEPSLRLQY